MSSETREIVTLQVGHFANFVGTHWWNLQESTFTYSPSELTEAKEIEHDILFREGKNLTGEVTYTPRLISLDLKGSLNTLKQDGSLYDIAGHDEVQWGDDVTLHKLDISSKNEFLRDLEEYDVGFGGVEKHTEERESDTDESVSEKKKDTEVTQTKIYHLDDSVSVWSDYLRLHLHPKSVHLLEEYQHNNDLQRFDMYGYGKQIMSSERERDELEDRVHYFLEECDHLQGMHLLVDTYDGFAGLGTALIQQVQDDYATKGFTVFGVSPPSFLKDSATEQAYRILNSVMAYDGFTTHGSAYVPLSTNTSLWKQINGHVEMPYLNYQPDLWYHSSAILGSSIDTTTLPYRLCTNPSMMSHLTDAMTAGGRKLLGLQTSLPFPLGTFDTMTSVLMASEELLWRPITPMFSHKILPYAQSVVLRGIKSNQIKGIANENMASEIREAKTGEDILEMYLRDICPKTLSAGCFLRQGLSVTAPFPHIFSPKVNAWGCVDTAERDSDIGVNTSPVMTSLQSSVSAIDHIKELLNCSSKLNVKKFNKLLQSGIEEDDYKEAFHNLESLIQVYRDDLEAIY